MWAVNNKKKKEINSSMLCFDIIYALDLENKEKNL